MEGKRRHDTRQTKRVIGESSGNEALREERSLARTYIQFQHTGLKRFLQ